MDGKLWNIGMRVADVAAETGYFTAAGGRVRVHEKFTTPDGDFEYALVEFGGTRLFITARTVFEHKLKGKLADGVTHIVFEVDDVDAEFARLVALGSEVLLAPHEISAGFGSRRIAFLRTPGGVVFEVMTIRTNLV